MANPKIPNGFAPVVQGYGIGDPGGVEQTAIDGGMPRMAQQFARGPQQFQVTMIMSPAKFSVWTAFYLRVINKGSKSFEMELDSGFGCEIHLCTIVKGSYSAVRVLTHHTSVSFAVLAVSTAYNLTDQEVEDLIDFWNETGEVGDDLLRRIEKFANVDTRVLDF